LDWGSDNVQLETFEVEESQQYHSKDAKRKPNVKRPTSTDQKALTTHPCPGCQQPLEAREWVVGNLKRIEVNTTSGWIRINTGRDTVLPCPLCLATKCGISPERWRDVSMHPIDLTRMQPRLRQHMIRTHKLTMRSPEVLSMRNFAKRMLCENLHTASPEFKPGLLLLQ